MTIFGVEIPTRMCPQTCLGKCGTVNEKAIFGDCYCDIACETYGDCCLDYFVHCFHELSHPSNQPTTTEEYDHDYWTNVTRQDQDDPGESLGDGSGAIDGTREIIMQEDVERRLWSVVLANPARFENSMHMNEECIYVNGSDGSLYLLVVTTCPASELAIHVPLCELNTRLARTIQEQTMVFSWGKYGRSPGQLYFNVHCALCHGVAVGENATLISPEFQCYDVDTEAERILQSKRYEELWRFLAVNCIATYDVTSFPTERLRCPKVVDVYQHKCPTTNASN